MWSRTHEDCVAFAQGWQSADLRANGLCDLGFHWSGVSIKSTIKWLSCNSSPEILWMKARIFWIDILMDILFQEAICTAYQIPVQARALPSLPLSLLLADPCAKCSVAHSVSVDWGLISVSNHCAAVLVVSAEEWGGGSSVSWFKCLHWHWFEVRLHED